MSEARPLHIWLVAGEESGDQLGAKLMQALKRQVGGPIVFSGIGGSAMKEEGLQTLFPLSDIAVMGIGAVVARLPLILRRLRQTVAAIVAARPDRLVIIDSPDFTQRVARRVHRQFPTLPILNYVSPSVWAWRPGRAKAMRAYISHVLAIQPFEPAVHRNLQGPPCTYIGHPIIERLKDLRPADPQSRSLFQDPLTILILPGSRRSEITRLMQPFGQVLAAVKASLQRSVRIVLPAVAHLAEEIRALSESWPIRPEIVLGEAAKFAAFRQAHVALAASGTVTLELAVSGVPMVVAYKVSKLEEQLKYFITAPSAVLPNLILGENAIPEYIQWDCTVEKLTAALKTLLQEGPERERQIMAFQDIDRLMAIGDHSPSEHAAKLVLETSAPLEHS